MGQWPDGMPKRTGGARPYASLKETPRIKGQELTPEVQVKNVNPHFSEASSAWPEVFREKHSHYYLPYNVNCVRCSMTFELRMRGYDLKAGAGGYRPEDPKAWNSADALARWIGPDGEEVQLRYARTPRGILATRRPLR